MNALAPTRLPSSAPVPRPPRHLSRESRALWAGIVREFDLERHHLAVLERACEALDRLRQAQAEIAADGITVMDRHGAPKLHPAVNVERDSRIAFLRAVRELGLDLEAPTSRPPSRWRS